MGIRKWLLTKSAQCLDFKFASSMDVALQHFLQENDKPSSSLFKELVSDFVICGRTTSGDIWDISRTGMIKNVSEFKEFIFSRLNISLGALGGTPAARTAAKVAAKNASAKANARSAVSQKRKDNFVGVYSSIFWSCTEECARTCRCCRCSRAGVW